MNPTGANIVAGSASVDGPASLVSRDPRSGAPLEPATHEATSPECDRACEAARAASPALADMPPGDIAGLLLAIADAIGDDRVEIVATADRETALGTDRLDGELNRTTGQLRFLAAVVLEGSHLEAVLDHDTGIRRVNVPLGPVAVFAASNFPLAFSVAGGDTGAALAAGCPVVVKAHPLHPHTSELTARAVARGVAAAGAPPGTFSLVHGFAAGERLVTDRRIRAVAFTGSLAGGTALAELAARRDVPIPVFAEMGSVNPVVVTSGALRDRHGEVLDGFVGSFLQGTGQFCTKPGLLFVPAQDADEVRDGLRRRLAGVSSAPLLGAGIRDRWQEQTAAWTALAATRRVHAAERDEAPGFHAGPNVLTVPADDWRAEPSLAEECFGPTAIVVTYRAADDLVAALATIDGSLTGTVHAAPDETDVVRRIHAVLAPRVGRLIHDGWPTGVAVGWAMHHGGPYPATTDGQHTSVGARAIRRFLRPLCFQGVPDTLLPPALRDANPLDLPRREGGRLRMP